MVSRFGACPLCGLGEAGAEHLWMWCPAVAMAWDAAAVSDTTMRDALLRPSEHAGPVAAFVSQVVFLYTAALNRDPLTPDEAAKRIGRALRALATAGDVPYYEVDGPEQMAQPRPRDDVAVWAQQRHACDTCGRRVEARLLSSARPAASVRAPTRSDHLRRTTVTEGELRAGQVVAVLNATSTPAAWLVAGNGWWPPPRVVSRAQATCEWTTTRCRVCGAMVATLTAHRHHAPGHEVTVPRAITPNPDAAPWPLEVSFDGATRRGTTGGSAGAAALLWVRDALLGMRCVARRIVALPAEPSAPQAEAEACRAALNLVADILHESPPGVQLPRARRARMVGDCAPVVRHAAVTARLRLVHRRHPIDAGLARALAQGWTLDWQLVERRLNREAHLLATEAATWAAYLAARGETEARCVHMWETAPDPVLPGLRLPAWPEG